MPADNWVKSLGLDKDGNLFVDIEGGMRLYDVCLDAELPDIINLSPQDLMRGENRQLYYCFLRTLKEIEGVIIHASYEKGCLVKNGDILVDAGARIGSFAAKMSASVGDQGRIIAIEPERHNYDCLLKNIEANQLTNVTAVRKMLWSCPQKMNLYLSGNASSHSAYRDPFYGSSGEYLSVEAQTLDGILEELGIDVVDFVKMDIEGSEIEALKGMQRLLDSDVQMSIAAYHPLNGGTTHTAVIKQLVEFGFTAVYEDGIVRAQRQSGITNDE